MLLQLKGVRRRRRRLLLLRRSLRLPGRRLPLLLLLSGGGGGGGGLLLSHRVLLGARRLQGARCSPSAFMVAAWKAATCSGVSCSVPPPPAAPDAPGAPAAAGAALAAAALRGARGAGGGIARAVGPPTGGTASCGKGQPPGTVPGAGAILIPGAPPAVRAGGSGGGRSPCAHGQRPGTSAGGTPMVVAGSRRRSAPSLVGTGSVSGPRARAARRPPCARASSRRGSAPTGRPPRLACSASPPAPSRRLSEERHWR